MNIPKIALPLLAAVALTANSADAALITFNINGTEGVPYEQTESEVKMTISNGNRAGEPGFEGEVAFTNMQGPIEIRTRAPGMFGFDMSFDKDVRIVSISFNFNPEDVYPESSELSFTLSAPNSLQSTDTIINGEVILSNANFWIDAGDTATWLVDFGGASGAQVEIVSITVEVIPEPSTVMLLTSVGFLGIGAYARRRRQPKSAA